MKQQMVFSKSWGPLLKFAILTSLLAGCGGQTDASKEASKRRPPASSDPQTAAEQRKWDSEGNLGSSSEDEESILESPIERETFLQDVTEQTPTYSTEQLTREAEEQFEKKEKPSAATKRPFPRGKKPVKRPGIPEIKVMPETDSKEGGPADIPASSPSAELCQEIDVTSAKRKVDLSPFYEDDLELPTSMPSKELEKAQTQKKKNKFVCILLPIAIRMNQEVFKQRVEVLRLQAKQAKGISLSKEDETWLKDIKNAYTLPLAASFEDLLQRVDIVPLPLLLAQAALESGWGQSRATRELNNLFGMHASKGQACKTGFDNACVRQFTSIGQGVSAYIRLLNVGKYYVQFREKRAQMRNAKEALDSIKLLQSLGKYNVTPVEYVQKVRELMTKSNKLTQFVFKEERN